MASTDQGWVTLTAQCLCKANTFTAKQSKARLPLQAYVCHCDSCRHVTGALYSVDVRWPVPRAEVDVSKLQVFHHFPSIDLLFCPTCSTPIFFADRNDKNRLLGVFTGVLPNENVDLVQFANHIFVDDTKDGGASVWLRHNANGSEIKRFKLDDQRNNPEELPSDWQPEKLLSGYEKRSKQIVPIRCKCKGIDFTLHHGDYTGVEENQLPFHIDPATHKSLAGFCGCDSCRLQCGVDLMHWTYSELKYITFNKDAPRTVTNASELKSLVDKKDPAIGTLRYYSASESADRYFCRTCSACVFYTNDLRPEIIDIAIGLLEASDGARAESLLSWPYGARIGHHEDADGGWRGKLFDKIEEEAEEYRVQRKYPKNWQRLAKDENGGRTPEEWYFGEVLS
ncbi:Mss4-like protein [Paraphoma chrysanthemicola]|uniref:Mss4-like protein n=1 Tax=Paraphoma chrysanthemicola TaxID=798071 RepID=A0A8K0QTG6_9PLEO|nr:Mss4-like protein [Paraphoma chrysanthemicola]